MDNVTKLRAFATGNDSRAPICNDELGGKGANLARMAAMGLPIPPGFILTTPLCAVFEGAGKQIPFDEWVCVQSALRDLEKVSGRRFGGGARRLLVSVRSGAPVSMPGMMDTVLNLGLNPDGVEALAEETGDARFAWDCYRRFVQMYANVVHGLELAPFEAVLADTLRHAAVSGEAELSPNQLRETTERFKRHFQSETGVPFPDDPVVQLRSAVEAVFASWHGERAQAYRRINGISDEMGTAVVVQRMVFGNLGPTSASGVMFTRDPSTGADQIMGEYLVNAQGEDVVAGIRTPDAIAGGANPMGVVLPEAHAQLMTLSKELERYYRDMQDIEFAVENGALWLLQTRAGKRSARATVECAVAFAEEGRISKDEAVLRVTPECLEACLHPAIKPGQEATALTQGLAASPGAASGQVVLSSACAKARAAEGVPVILVRDETSPEDIEGMHAATGIMTATGGQTSHAAVVARGMGRPCVCGAGALSITDGAVSVGSHRIEEGDWITVDGSTGTVYLGQLEMVAAEAFPALDMLLNWADDIRQLGVRANAETAEDAMRSRALGAEGIGLVRTEHMFFSDAGILAMRQMILADTLEDRDSAFAELGPMQTEGFLGVFRAMAGLPVTVRLLDPPLHEFLPRKAEEFKVLAGAMGCDPTELRARAARMSELNPMLGHRGCRLAVSYPGLVRMQVRAMAKAIAAVVAEGMIPPVLEIMVPLVGAQTELTHVRALIDAELAASYPDLHYTVGTMIELPSAALSAGPIAAKASFFSFGTNDLTHTTLGISRDDSSHFMQVYRDTKIFGDDPFASLDLGAVGQLISMAAAAGRATRPDLKMGACGEHAGDPASIAFFASVGLDYVSCSPMRLPVARLAAAQAEIARVQREPSEPVQQKVA